MDDKWCNIFWERQVTIHKYMYPPAYAAATGSIMKSTATATATGFTYLQILTSVLWWWRPAKPWQLTCMLHDFHFICFGGGAMVAYCLRDGVPQPFSLKLHAWKVASGQHLTSARPCLQKFKWKINLVCEFMRTRTGPLKTEDQSKPPPSTTLFKSDAPIPRKSLEPSPQF